MYRTVEYSVSKIGSFATVVGETIEQKIERIVSNKEPIKDGAPEIFTERKEGVIAAYNIRTDRFEIACDAMDKVAGSIIASRDHVGKSGDVNANEGDLSVVNGKEDEGAA